MTFGALLTEEIGTVTPVLVINICGLESADMPISAIFLQCIALNVDSNFSF